MNPPDTPTITGYPRVEVDEFLAAAAEEKSRLEAVISDAETRVSRARSAVGAHQVMVQMLLESQQELSRIRRDAEAEAEAIVARAELDAQAILSGQPTPVPVTAPPVAIATPGPFESAAPLAVQPDGPVDGNDEFFTFLRGALADEQPLGPAPEQESR
ncbi:MAG TPA: DivIVA domain-containing protein [Acidimicrobiia bacterium]